MRLTHWTVKSCTYVRVLKDVEELIHCVVSLKLVRIDKMAMSLLICHVHEETLKHTD